MRRNSAIKSWRPDGNLPLLLTEIFFHLQYFGSSAACCCFFSREKMEISPHASAAAHFLLLNRSRRSTLPIAVATSSPLSSIAGGICMRMREEVGATFRSPLFPLLSYGAIFHQICCSSSARRTSLGVIDRSARTAKAARSTSLFDCDRISRSCKFCSSASSPTTLPRSRGSLALLDCTSPHLPVAPTALLADVYSSTSTGPPSSTPSSAPSLCTSPSATEVEQTQLFYHLFFTVK
ncbi:hypothetical protein BHM03_00042569 [Ensete ventricosum]|nr:hypothetical protein BHM03_00042569 [Ensete ventricosum]